MQRPWRVAPAGAKLQGRRGAAVRAGKVGGEPRQVGRRRAAPPVDRLDRIADRGQGQLVVDSAAEQCRQRDTLRVAGVLVLVEQAPPDTGSRSCSPTCGNVDASRAAEAICMPKSITFSARMLPMQRVDQRHEFGAFGLGGQHPQQPLARAALALIRPGGQGVHQPLEFDVGVAQLLGVDEMLGQLTGQPQHHRGHCGRASFGVSARMLAHDAKRQLPQFGFAHQPGVGLDRQQQTVLAQQIARERVVGADGRGVVGPVDARGPTRSGTRPAPASRASRVRTRRSSCPAALRVNVKPSTSPGRAYPLATSHTTRAAIVSVLPAPAPAMTTSGPGGAAITAACSSVGAKSPSAEASSAGL